MLFDLYNVFMMQRDIHLTPGQFLRSLRVKPDACADTALISGRPGRAGICLDYLKGAVKIFSFLGHTFWTGDYKGRRVTVGSGGLFAPDAAIITELLCAAGARTLLRLGSCGALTGDLSIGDLVLVEEVLRGDGVTGYYVDPAYVARTDRELTENLAACIKDKAMAQKGKVWTTDALFRETKEVVNDKISQGACAVDMVSSPFVTIASLYGRRAGAVLVVTDSLVSGETGFTDPRAERGEEVMVRAAFEALEKDYLKGGDK